MTTIVRGIVAGLAATLVVSAFLVAQEAAGFMPQLDVIGALADLAGSGRGGGWLAHFGIGITWGIVFAALDRNLPGGPHTVRGLVFGFFAWFLMMITFLPSVGAGLFGLRLGYLAPVVTGLIHAVFGLVLGAVYGALVGMSNDRLAFRDR